MPYSENLKQFALKYVHDHGEKSYKEIVKELKKSVHKESFGTLSQNTLKSWIEKNKKAKKRPHTEIENNKNSNDNNIDPSPEKNR